MQPRRLYSKRVRKSRRRALLSWLVVCLLAVLCSVLGYLQYRWIGEISRAERERLHKSLEASLAQMANAFESELNAEIGENLPRALSTDREERERQYAGAYLPPREKHLVKSVSLAVPEGDGITLRTLNAQSGMFEPRDWPAQWMPVRERMLRKLETRRPGGITEDFPDLVELPYFGPPSPPFREQEWLLLELDLDYIRTFLIPELARAHLAAADYELEIVARRNSSSVIFRSTPEAENLRAGADASALMFTVPFETLRRRGPPRRAGMGPPGPPRGATGRWVISVRHKSGSLEKVVERARMRNLAVSAALLTLIVATMAALLRYTRRAQRLAELQVEFVAGISHELRTPLTVMRTAGHNLQSRMARDPQRVERYGALIQRESERLNEIVEQILGFANAGAGRVILSREPVGVEGLLEEVLELERKNLSETGCTIERHISRELPAVMGDATALKQALQNVVGNAAKYGRAGDWIGISAEAISEGGRNTGVEIRIADHGPGIAARDAKHIFEPFYRGEMAVAEQIHGTGLGLSLAKRIIDAHDGQIAVRSEPGKGAEFVIRLPAASVEPDHEFANTTD